VNIGVDISCWINKRGFGRFTRELLNALLDVDRQNEYWLFLDASTAIGAEDLPSASRARTVVVETTKAASRAASASGRRSLADLWAMSRAVQRHARHLDVFYFPTIYTFFPVTRALKLVVTGHDTTAEQFPQLIFPNRRAQLFWNVKAQWAYRRADAITAVSGSAKQDLVKRFGLGDDRVKVIPDGVTPDFCVTSDPSGTRDVLRHFGVSGEERFLLYVGGISPHKNIGTLVTAFASLVCKRPEKPLKLLLVGDFQHDVFFSDYQSIRQQVDRLGLNDRVCFTGFVPDRALPHFYNAAVATVMPSLAEGFGLPALESMACGVPVVASCVGALPEVVGDTGLLFDPRLPEDLERCLVRLLDDEALRNRLASRALERARTYSWPRSAHAMRDLFEAVCESPLASCDVASV